MEDGSILLSMLFFLLLLLGAAFFAVAETAYSTLSAPRLHALAEKGGRRAAKALWIADNFDRAITTVLICTNLLHLTAAAVVTVAVTRLWSMKAVVWGTVFTTITVFFAGELLPKTLARKYSGKAAFMVAPTLCFFMRVFRPLERVLTHIGQGISSRSGSEAEPTVTEDELYDLIEDMTDDGRLDENRGELVQSALDFGDITVENVLTARVDLAAVDIAQNAGDIARFVAGQRHSRFPVYEGTVDNIIGILQMRKFSKAYLRTGADTEVRALLDEAYFIPAGTCVADLLPEMSRRRLNMAVVTDAWGGTLGVVTVEDILEELVGEIWDEEDEVVEYFLPLGGGRYEADGGLSVGECFDNLSFDDPEKNEDIEHLSMAEWALERLEHMPRLRESFDYHGLRFTITDLRQHRIRKLTVQPVPAEPAEGGADA